VKGARRIIRAGLIALAAALFAVSCQQPYEFEEYDGTDLISSQGFESGQWLLYDTAAAPDEDPWVPADSGHTYVNFEAVDAAALGLDTSALPTQPDGTAEAVYRLEIRNLLANGDFEETAPGSLPAQWGQTLPDIGQVISGAGAIDGHTLRLQFGQANAVYTDLATHLTDFQPDTPYRFLFEMKTVTDSVGVELNNGPPPGGESKTGYSLRIARPGGATADTVLRFPEDPGFGGNNTLVPDTAYSQFSFGGNSANASVTINAFVDNLRMVRTDVPLHVRLPIPREGSGRPDILGGGTYAFTVFVRDDPTVHDVASGGGNRFRANGLSVSLNPLPGEPTVGYFETAERTDDWTDWTQLSFALDGQQLSEGDSVVDLLLMPSLPGRTLEVATLDAGSLLLAAPRLYWAED
jgi:hypothetical protein